MTPTEKHRAEAERLIRESWKTGKAVDGIAAALANSEREGMKRAAEIVDARMILYPSVGQKNAVRECVSSILSEAGDA